MKKRLPALLLTLSCLIGFFSLTAWADDPDEEENLPAYNIELRDQASSSDCESVQIAGDTITITEAGEYSVTGSLSDGQIRVETDKESKVRLTLNGVSITNTDSAAIYVVSADKLVIRLADGSENSLNSVGQFL